MNKLVFTFTLLIGTLLTLHADFLPRQVQSQITQTNGKSTWIDTPLPIGSSGIVVHAFDDTHKTITAEAVVTQTKEGKSEVVFRKFKRLRQPALPEYNIKPQKGDILILNYLYNRILPIVPDKTQLDAFQRKYGSSYDIIHPDIFAAQLYFDHEPKPSKEEFVKSCYQNDSSLLYFAIEDKGYFVDCNSFKVIAQEPLAQPVDNQKAQKPLYSRLPKIKTRLGGIISDDSIGDYNLYYKKMLGLK